MPVELVQTPKSHSTFSQKKEEEKKVTKLQILFYSMNFSNALSI